MRISDWSSDVCSSDLRPGAAEERDTGARPVPQRISAAQARGRARSLQDVVRRYVVTVTQLDRSRGHHPSRTGRTDMTDDPMNATSPAVRPTVGDRKSTRLNSSH